MIKVRNQFFTAPEVDAEDVEQSLPHGYEPDEDDPAWPSHSGQAD